MRMLLVCFLLLGLSLTESAAANVAKGVPTTDIEFASHVLRFSVAGRKTDDVLKDLSETGFTCLQHESRVLSSSTRSVTYQMHRCGGPVPALHGCSRNVELGTFDGTLKHIRVSLLHPNGMPNVGIHCAR